MKILIIAGGTGGHIFPALAVAEKLKSEGHQVFWLGAEYGLEKKLVGDKFPMETIVIDQFRGKGLSSIKSFFQLFNAIRQSKKLMKKIRPDVVLTMGGYVTVPGGIASKLSKIPLVIHEQNARAGMSNRILAKFANTILAAFPNAFKKNNNAVIGNPVRQEILAITSPKERLKNRGNPMRLLVLGGSQGARSVNQLVADAAKKLPANSLEIIHQTGDRFYQETPAFYKDCPQQVTIKPFIENMAEAYAWADFAIARAGALSVAELAAAGVGSLLIPYPFAVDDHQWHNGQYLVQGEAAIQFRQNNLTVDQLAEILNSLIKDPAKRLKMAENARNLAKPKSTQAIVESIIKNCKLAKPIS